MKVVAVIGASGGAGATTVASHLATAIAQQGKPVLCFDFCPTNVLRLHFGAALAEREGFAATLMVGSHWQQAAYASASGVGFLPFGMLDSDAALERLCRWLDERPRWFHEALAGVDLAADTIVICDCPRLPAALRSQVLAVADLTLVACAPEPLSLASASRIASQMQQHGGAPGAILLNAFDAARALDRDMQLLLRRQHGLLAVPLAIHRDESLREALAHKQTVFDYAPASLAAQEFSALATWTLARSAQAMQAALP